jgi:predicted dehydrogenase
MLNIGIIGCGKIADQHLDVIKYIPECEIVGVCDNEILMAKQLYQRYDIKSYYSNINEFLEKAKPNVVHITTPPQSHYQLGSICLDAGCHIYVEKPFTINTEEAEALLSKAEEKNLKVTVGHNAQFTHAARRMRKLIANGYLGGPPVHLEAYYCYNLGDPVYARAVLGDKGHWVRNLPGKLLQNIISHGISKIAEFLSGKSLKVIAHGFRSPVLESIGEEEIIDELRVIIQDNNRTSAYFTFSSQMKPILHQLRLYGPKNSLIVDDDHETIMRLKGEKYKSYLDQFIPQLNNAKQNIGNSIYNIIKFIKFDFHMNSGMIYLINSFYKSIVDNGSPPISYKEILITSIIMDEIFKQIYD